MISPAECFKELFQTQINRPGADKLLEWLESTDFFTAPASTKYHGVYEGALVEHSLNTYYELLNGPVAWRYSAESRAITGLLHDVCKANFYTKTETGWAVNDRLPMGHGEKSVYLIMKHMELTDDEALAIRWHMGGFDETKSYAMSQAYERYPIAVKLHLADLESTYLREKGTSAVNN